MQQQKRKPIYKKEENGITLGMIIITTFSISLVLLLTLPKIYLHNQIYYESREIAHYRNIAQTLREEHSIILHKLEAIKYKENIEDQE
jgi:competence protein ComGC